MRANRLYLAAAAVLAVAAVAAMSATDAPLAVASLFMPHGHDLNLLHLAVVVPLATLRTQLTELNTRAAAKEGEIAAEGAEVREVTQGSIADDSGLQNGDVITKVNDTQITGADSLVATVRSYRPGDKVTVTYVRDGETNTTSLVLDSDG